MMPIPFKIIIFSISLCLISISANAQKPDSWQKDLQLLQRTLKKKHPALFQHISKEEFRKGMDKLANNGFDSIRSLIELRLFLAQIGDSHIYARSSDNDDWKETVPIICNWFPDGLHVTACDSLYQNILTNKIISINNYQIETIADSFKSLFAYNNEAEFKLRIQRLLQEPKLLQHFGFMPAPGYITLKSTNTNGDTINSRIRITCCESINIIDYIPPSIPLYKKNIIAKEYILPFWQEYIESDSILYIQYNNCTSREMALTYGYTEEFSSPSFSIFQAMILKTIREKPVKKLIFDVRFNGGGGSRQGDALARELAKTPINKKGKLFVITGRRTFSATIHNVMTFKRETQAIIIGENTSGKPNHYREVRKVYLPFSKFVVYFSTRYHKTSEINDNTIIPDIYTPLTFNEYLQGIDPAYNAILNYK